MECTLRPWRMTDSTQLAAIINNPNILNNLRDGLPYPYTVRDAEDFISSELAADPHQVFPFAITVEEPGGGQHRRLSMQQHSRQIR